MPCVRALRSFRENQDEKKDMPDDTGSEEWRDLMADSVETLSSTVRVHSRLLTIYTIILVSAVCAGIIFL